MSLYSTTALSLVVLDTDWVPPSGSVVDLHLVQLEVDVDVHSGREGHWVRNRTQWIRFRTQLDIMHKQTWINHDRITLFKKFFQFPSLLIIVEFSTLKNLGNLTTKNSTHHEFVATDHEFVATDHEFVATDYEFVVWTSFIYCIKTQEMNYRLQLRLQKWYLSLSNQTIIVRNITTKETIREDGLWRRRKSKFCVIFVMLNSRMSGNWTDINLPRYTLRT